MPKKFAFIGAGSFGFTRSLVRDILSFPAFADAEIALMDVHAERLAEIKKAVERIVEAGNYPAKVTATLDRVEALKGADGVITTILHGEVDVWQHDILIPKKYGVDTNVGDTRGRAAFSASCARSTRSWTSPATSTAIAPRRCTSTTPTPWRCCAARCRARSPK